MGTANGQVDGSFDTVPAQNTEEFAEYRGVWQGLPCQLYCFSDGLAMFITEGSQYQNFFYAAFEGFVFEDLGRRNFPSSLAMARFLYYLPGSRKFGSLGVGGGTWELRPKDSLGGGSG